MKIKEGDLITEGGISYVVEKDEDDTQLRRFIKRWRWMDRCKNNNRFNISRERNMYLTIEDKGGCYDTARHATLAEAVDHACDIHKSTGATPLGVKVDLRHSAVDLEPLVQEVLAEDCAEHRCEAQDAAWRSS